MCCPLVRTLIGKGQTDSSLFIFVFSNSFQGIQKLEKLHENKDNSGTTERALSMGFMCKLRNKRMSVASTSKII